MLPLRYVAMAAVAAALSVGGGVAYAAQGSTTTTPSTTTPSTTAPQTAPHSGNCPNMGTNSGSSSSGAAYYPSSNV